MSISWDIKETFVSCVFEGFLIARILAILISRFNYEAKSDITYWYLFEIFLPRTSKHCNFSYSFSKLFQYDAVAD